MKFDAEEKNILAAYNSGIMKPKTPSKKEVAAIKAAANNTLKKIKRDQAKKNS